MAEAKKKANDAQAEHREALKAAHEEMKAEFDYRHERAMALLAVPQKVVDGNETAALATITGWKPLRDESDAPPPEPLGTRLADENAEREAAPARAEEPKTSAKVS